MSLKSLHTHTHTHTIAYCNRARNSIQHILKVKNPNSNDDKFRVSGVNNLTFCDCGEKNILDRLVEVLDKRFKKHLRSFRNNNCNSEFSQYLP